MDAGANSARLILPLALMIEIATPRWARFTACSCLLSASQSLLDWGILTAHKLSLSFKNPNYCYVHRLIAAWREGTPLEARRLSLDRRQNRNLLSSPLTWSP